MDRRARIIVSSEIFSELLTTGWNDDGIFCTDGLPEGANLVDAQFFANELRLTFEHESFAPLLEGQTPPVLTPRYVKVTADTSHATMSVRQNDDATPLE